MKKKFVYEINNASIKSLDEAVDEIIGDLGRDAFIRNIEFHQDCYGDGTIAGTEFEITVEAR